MKNIIALIFALVAGVVSAYSLNAYNFYLPAAMKSSDVGYAKFSVAERDGSSQTFDAIVNDDGELEAEELDAYVKRNSGNIIFQTAYKALERALLADIQVKLLSNYVYEMMCGDGFYVQYSDINGNSKTASVKYYSGSAGLGEQPPAGVYRESSLKTGSVSADGVTIEKVGASNSLGIMGWANGTPDEVWDLSTYLSGQTTLVNPSAYEYWKIPVRNADGNLRYLPIGKKLLPQESLVCDDESVTTNEVTGGELSIVGFNDAKSEANGIEMFPYTTGGGIEWGALGDFADDASIEANDEGYLAVKGFSDATSGTIASVGDNGIEWQTIDEFANSALFGKDANNKLILNGYSTPMQANTAFGTDGSGNITWRRVPTPDGVSIVENAQDGKMSIAWPSASGYFAATANGWASFEPGSGGGGGSGYEPDGQSLAKSTNGSVTNLIIYGWNSATTCEENLHDLLVDDTDAPTHEVLCRVTSGSTKAMHYLPLGTDKFADPDGTTIEAAGNPKKLRIKAGTSGKFLKSGASGVEWGDVPVKSISADSSSSITVTPGADGSYTIGGGGGDITFNGDNSSTASGRTIKIESASDSAVKVNVTKSGDVVTVKIGVYYK